MHRIRSNDGAGRLRSAIVVAAVLAAGTVPAAASDLKIRSPIIEPGELEFENNFTLGLPGDKNTVHELEYGFNDWLKLGVETETEALRGHGLRYDATSLEGFLQLTPQGKYWADVGLFAEYENTVRPGDPSSLNIGPLVQKEAQLFGLDTVHTVNFLFIKKMAPGPLGLLVAEQSLLRLDPHFQPGLEYYGTVTLGAHGDDPEHRLGPAFAGRVGFRELGIEAPGGIKYDAAYLRGLTPATDPSTFRIRFEFEFPL